jgi:hydrophobic/amphiphilic exporter-1 (mainly G- bacteria), HAE1 family
MTLPELSIKRHVMAYMFGVILIVLGLLSYKSIGIDKYPDVDFPIIVVTTTMKGANPEVIDSAVTNIIEEKVNSISGIDFIKSTSSTGISTVMINFLLEKDVEVAFNEVRSKIDQAVRELPREADAPIIAKVDATSAPVLWLTLTGDRTLPQLNNYANTVLKKKLETISGVGEVKLGGLRARNIRVELNASKMAGFKVGVNDIKAAFANEHKMYPGGFLVSQKSEHLLKLDTEYHSPDLLAEMIVYNKNNSPVRLKDIAVVRDDLEDNRKSARLNGEPTVGLGIVKVKGGNTVQIIENVKEKLATEIMPLLPAGVKLTIASNDATFIHQLVASLQEHLLLGTFLTAFIVWFFLKNMRSTVIISIAIPVSLLGAIAIMYLFGYTFNKLTLLALLLLIGVVVDDAIVVLENIYRHIEEGKDRVTAAFDGSSQVFFAVLAATLSLVAIFGPVMFMGGMIGRFFKSFAVVVTFGVLVSFFVSLTLTPMLCSKYLAVEKSNAKAFGWIDRFFAGLDSFYRKALALSLRHRWKVVLLTIVFFFLSFVPFAHIGKGFVPYEDQGKFLIFAKCPQGSNISYMQDKLDQIEKTLKEYPEIGAVYSTIGSEGNQLVSESYTVVNLIDKDKRDKGLFCLCR